MTFLYLFCIAVFMFLCVILCSVILMQESKSSGLGTTFGGDAGTSLFGTSTADVLKKFTAWTAAIFLTLCVLLSLWTESMGRVKSKAPPTVIEQIEPE